jgi:hypothetical protein
MVVTDDTLLQVPVMLGVGMFAYNSQAAEPLTLAEEASLLGGFLSFKAAHIMYVYDQLRPRFGAKKTRIRRTFDDPPDEFDMYARKQQQAKGVEEADRILAEEEARKAKKQWFARHREERVR